MGVSVFRRRGENLPAAAWRRKDARREAAFSALAEKDRGIQAFSPFFFKRCVVLFLTEIAVRRAYADRLPIAVRDGGKTACRDITEAIIAQKAWFVS